MTTKVMDPDLTMKSMLTKAQRKVGAPLRRAFVQGGSRYEPKPGPLADFIHNRDLTGLRLYLLALTLATNEPFQILYPGGWWARALRLSNEALVSRAWARLEARRLISRQRDGRNVVVTMRMDDGSGLAYTRPTPSVEPYGMLRLPFWEDGWFVRLDLPATAMFLIAVTRPQLRLPAEHAPRWYGFSADTVERGFRTLLREKVLSRRPEWRIDRRSSTGYTESYLYQLLPPFASSKGARLRIVS
jgi:hypothetical protein